MISRKVHHFPEMASTNLFNGSFIDLMVILKTRKEKEKIIPWQPDLLDQLERVIDNSGKQFTLPELNKQ